MIDEGTADSGVPGDPRSSRPLLMRLVTLPEDLEAENINLRNDLLTVPNLITIVRLLCIPVFVWLLFTRDARFGAALLLGGIGATDWVDGWAARALDQHSAIGKILDPIADRVMFVVAIISMMIDGSVALWFAIAVLVREVLISLVTLGMEVVGAPRFDVTWLGKAATFGLMFTFPFLLAGASDNPSAPVFLALGWIVGIPSLIASWWTFVEYGPAARRAMRETMTPGVTST